MGASIYWQPVNGKHLSVGARSAFVAMLTEAFGSYPWTLDDSHFEVLRGMRAATDQGPTKAALDELIDGIYTHERIIVTVEY